MDEILKTLIFQAPNFIGFIVLAYVLTRFVIMPMMAHHEAQDKLIFDLAMRLADCGKPANGNGQKETD